MSAAEQELDVAVLGAGAAGLYAAAELSRSGHSVVLLEARNRIGGRIDTRHVGGLGLPIELGAEFIHGEAPLTRELLLRAGLSAVDTSGRRIGRRRNGQAVRAGEFEQARRLLQRAEALPADQSVAQFLQQQLSAPAEQPLADFVRLMVEGFDAADPQRASVKAIAAEWSGDSLQGQARPLGGYGPMLSMLARQLDPARARLMLETVVQAVEWGASGVHITARAGGSTLSCRAACAVIALPVSILKLPPGAAGAVHFDPPLQAKRAALEELAVGPVIKVVLQFRRAFWEHGHGGAFADAGFLHAPDAAFPTLWTALPFRAPLLTAWAGGPRAQRLAAAGRDELIGQALSAAGEALDCARPLQAELVQAHVHDWGSDPYARGAYSYIGVGGADAPRQLAEPLGERLFFAGEAADPDVSGTVEAALQSGRRAARAVLSRLRAMGRNADE